MNESLKYQSAEERRGYILDALREAAYVSQGDLSRWLGVSEMTIRRDARRLADEGLCVVVRGGVSRTDDVGAGTDFRIRSRRFTTAKRAIARVALSMVADGMTLVLDSGTTTVELAKLLRPPVSVTVVTNSLPAEIVLAGRPGITVVGLGGVLHTESQSFAGPATLDSLRRLHADLVFLAASAADRGAVYCGNVWESEVKRGMIAIGDAVILLVDSSKFALHAMARVAPLTAIRTMVVDDGIKKADLEAIEASGVEVVVVPIAEAPRPAAPEAALAAPSGAVG